MAGAGGTECEFEQPELGDGIDAVDFVEQVHVAGDTGDGGGSLSSGAATLSSTLDVAGDVDVNSGKFAVTASDGSLAISSNKFTVAGNTGNTVVAGLDDGGDSR